MTHVAIFNNKPCIKDPTLAASNYCIIRSNSEKDSTMKTINIGSDRILHLAKNNEITIRDKVTKKAAVFTHRHVGRLSYSVSTKSTTSWVD